MKYLESKTLYNFHESNEYDSQNFYGGLKHKKLSDNLIYMVTNQGVVIYSAN